MEATERLDELECCTANDDDDEDAIVERQTLFPPSASTTKIGGTSNLNFRRGGCCGGGGGIGASAGAKSGGGGGNSVLKMAVGLFMALCVLQAGVAAARKSESVIEDVNGKQLEKIIEEKDYVAVYWYTKRCGACEKALAELEKIDDETDDFGVDFVKVGDKKVAKQHGITTFPALQYFRNQEPIIYEGE
ncbi:unnamed protein product [Notodromas monacha]|uniref:Thioredoxin domain-containing protein n=1 Tax=Notodromas monacha TaxID=399045 RepID=A0A7R9BEY0_9CRUS|nr:unnamed protein product [Notodromas monacha]CAG0914128.1 unnamed protein product [Notodromas monacha]